MSPGQRRACAVLMSIPLIPIAVAAALLEAVASQVRLLAQAALDITDAALWGLGRWGGGED